MSQQFDENGNYIKTDWKAGDKITATKLNKIEESIEAVNNNDISRHVEADARLDALESSSVSDKSELQANIDALEDTVVANKDELDLDIYRIDQHMTLLDKKIDDGVAEVNAVAETVDGKIATAEANMTSAVNQGKADMEAMVAEVEGELAEVNSHSLDWINVVSLGVDNTNTIECSSQINEIIELNQGKTIYLPRGRYKVVSPIIVDGVDFVCDGEIVISDNIGLNLTSSRTNVKIKKIIGSDYENRKGVGLKVGSDSKMVTNSYVSIGMISECETALFINPDNDYGVQCSTFEFDNLSRSTYGIKIQGGDTGVPWVNENKFICRGSLNCECGIYSKKGANMIDPYNGNKFINMSVEQCVYPFVLEYMNSNTFENIRCNESENGLVDYIFNLSQCNLNTFTSNIPNSIQMINEVNCNNNLYDFIIQKETNGTYVGKSLRTNNGINFLTKGVGISHYCANTGAYNKTFNTSDYIQKIEFITMGHDHDMSCIVILDDRYGIDGGDYNEFIVDVKYVGNNGSLQIKDQSDNILFDETKLTVGQHLIKFIGGKWYSFKAN